MYKSARMLNKNEDTKLKIKPIKGFNYSVGLQAAPITIKEFYEACKSQPIVFTKTESGEFLAQALLGLDKDKNVFVNKNGDWLKGKYIPAFVRRYPFIFSKVEDKFALAIDEDSNVLDETTGEALFDNEGEATPYLANVMKFMEEYQDQITRTQLLAKMLDELGLLEPARVEGNVNGKEFSLTGFLKVNEEKFNDLEDAKVLELAKSGLYKLVTAHLISLSNFGSLTQLD